MMFRHLPLTQADVPDFWTHWIVDGFGLGNPSPLFYGHPRVEVGRINAHPPMMNKTAQLQKHRSLIKRLFPNKLQNNSPPNFTSFCRAVGRLRNGNGCITYHVYVTLLCGFKMSPETQQPPGRDPWWLSIIQCIWFVQVISAPTW